MQSTKVSGRTRELKSSCNEKAQAFKAAWRSEGLGSQAGALGQEMDTVALWFGLT